MHGSCPDTAHTNAAEEPTAVFCGVIHGALLSVRRAEPLFVEYPVFVFDAPGHGVNLHHILVDSPIVLDCLIDVPELERVSTSQVNAPDVTHETVVARARVSIRSGDWQKKGKNTVTRT